MCLGMLCIYIYIYRWPYLCSALLCPSNRSDTDELSALCPSASEFIRKSKNNAGLKAATVSDRSHADGGEYVSSRVRRDGRWVRQKRSTGRPRADQKIPVHDGQTEYRANTEQHQVDDKQHQVLPKRRSLFGPAKGDEK